jgi:hypothetical protein
MDERLLRIAAREHRDRSHQARNLAILAIAVAAGLGGITYALKEVARSQPQQAKVVIDPAQLPPIRPGPQ